MVAAGLSARVILVNWVLPLLVTDPLTPTRTTTLLPISTSVVPGTHSLVMMREEFTLPWQGAVVVSVTVLAPPGAAAACANATSVNARAVVTNVADQGAEAPGAMLAATGIGFAGVCVPVAFPGVSTTSTS